MNKLQFQLLLPFLYRRYYHGHIRWLLIDKQQKNIYCAFCGNYANGLGHRTIGHFRFDLPVCKSHIQQLNPDVEQAPFYASI